MKLQPVDFKGQGPYEREDGGRERGRSIGRPQVCEEGGSVERLYRGRERLSARGERWVQCAARGGGQSVDIYRKDGLLKACQGSMDTVI